MSVDFASILRAPKYWPPVRPGRRAMRLEHYKALEHHPGWKYEYIEGNVIIRPRHAAVGAALAVERFSGAERPWAVEPVCPGDDGALRRLYKQTFGGHVDLFGATMDEVAEHAFKDLQTYFTSAPSPASGLIRDGLGRGHLAGALLIIEGPPASPYLGRSLHESELQLLMVQPAFQGCGIAGALLAFAVDRLRDDGVETLFSAYHLANDRGRRWYQRQGFVERPNRLAVGAMLRRARQLQQRSEAAEERRRLGNEIALLRRLKQATSYAAAEH